VPTKTPLTSGCLSTPSPERRIVADAALFLVQRFGTHSERFARHAQAARSGPLLTATSPVGRVPHAQRGTEMFRKRMPAGPQGGQFTTRLTFPISRYGQNEIETLVRYFPQKECQPRPEGKKDRWRSVLLRTLIRLARPFVNTHKRRRETKWCSRSSSPLLTITRLRLSWWYLRFVECCDWLSWWFRLI
jgi:hypothetical protein